MNSNFYRPQTKLREGSVFTGVRNSVHKGVWSRGDACSQRGGLVGGGLVQGGVWSQGVPDPGGGLSGPGECLVPGGVWSRGLSGPRGGCLVETPWTATATSGTHPTGMHSCDLFRNHLEATSLWCSVSPLVSVSGPLHSAKAHVKTKGFASLNVLMVEIDTINTFSTKSLSLSLHER